MSSIVFIIGTTSVGKTKLSVYLAQQINGEIISADSMQVYQQADLLTAKASKEEQDGVPHHCLDLVQLECRDFTRHMYVQEAVKQIEQVRSRGKIPIVVGGTHYYLEALLFFTPDENAPMESQKTREMDSEEKIGRYEIPSEKQMQENWEALKQIDPMITNKYHPHDYRKISNYLNLYKTTQTIPSSRLATHHQNQQLRYPNSIVFWPKCIEQSVLDIMIRQRVDAMCCKEGLEEIVKVFDAQKGDYDFHRGIMQAIGYKEFFPFYQMFKQMKTNEDVFEAVQSNEQLREQLEKDKQNLKQKTIQFTKRQIQWIHNRLLHSPLLSSRLYVLTFSDKASFDSHVLQPALQIYNNISYNLVYSTQKYIETYGVKIRQSSIWEWKQRKCERCDLMISGENEWENHLRSRKHKYLMKYTDDQLKQKQAHIDKYKAIAEEKMREKEGEDKQR